MQRPYEVTFEGTFLLNVAVCLGIMGVVRLIEHCVGVCPTGYIRSTGV